MGIDKDPEHPEHYYDYKAAFKAGEPIPKKGEHMSSKYKSPLHPRRFLPGDDPSVNKPEFAMWDTLNEKEAEIQDIVKANYDRNKLLEDYGF